MKRRIFAAVATSSLILPFGVNAARANVANKNPEFPSTIRQIAQNSPHHKRMGRGGGMEKMLEPLNLSDEQSQQIEAIKKQSSTDNETLHQEMQANHETMKSLLTGEASVEQLREQHQKMQALRQQLDDNRFETMLQIRAVLTPEQRTQMAELMAQKRERRGEREGNFER